MGDFETLYSNTLEVVQSQKINGIVSEEIKSLLEKFYNEMIKRPINIDNLQDSIIGLLTFLSWQGRTSVNCWVVDTFIAAAKFETLNLPTRLRDVIIDLGGALHNTFSSAADAVDSGSTPEDLLYRIKNIKFNKETKMKKKPWLAVVLNILITGLGYVYVGKRKLFGILLIAIEILGYIWYSTNKSLANDLLSSPWLILSHLIFVVAISFDVYQDAKEVNSKE